MTKNKVKLEMKASAELNSSIAKDLMKEDPDQQDAMASIERNKDNKDADTSED